MSRITPESLKLAGQFWPDLNFDELDELDEEDNEEWLENPVMGAEELLRFSRIHQLLQQYRILSESYCRNARRWALLDCSGLLLLIYATQANTPLQRGFRLRVWLPRQ